jgi:hypothetical protein
MVQCKIIICVFLSCIFLDNCACFKILSRNILSDCFSRDCVVRSVDINVPIVLLITLIFIAFFMELNTGKTFFIKGHFYHCVH